eukprot:UN31745
MVIFLAFMLDFLNANDLTVKILAKFYEKRFKLPKVEAAVRAARTRQIITYVFISSLLIFTLTAIKQTEDWSYLELMYFLWISLTTIGYGDYVPSNSTSQGLEWYGLLMLLVVPLLVADMTLMLDISSKNILSKIENR